MSETSKCRSSLLKFCHGVGLDLGYGGDPISKFSITLDLPHPYTNVGDYPCHICGDARNLYWFANNVLDYVYSSHLFEDFELNQMPLIIKEWLRVIKINGFLVLYLPDQQRYLESCRKLNQPPNGNHKIDNFSLSFMKKNILSGFDNINIFYENDILEDYSFEIVIQKIK